MKNDQRSYERRVPIGNVYAALGRNYEKVGKLIDLSLGGLGFEYMPNEYVHLQAYQIDIFKVGEVINLHKLPCRIVYDFPLLPVRDGIESLKKSPNRRCGVEFKSMPEESSAQLALFLESHTKTD